jgi:hypothetical protein
MYSVSSCTRRDGCSSGNADATAIAVRNAATSGELRREETLLGISRYLAIIEIILKRAAVYGSDREWIELKSGFRVLKICKVKKKTFRF